MTVPPASYSAISVKQPWAALIVAGRKTVEIRRWATRVRGPVLIHAAKVDDDRPEAWQWVDSPAVADLCQMTGGLLGIANLRGCHIYRDQAGFDRDRPRHLNEPAWFTSPMYGFEFADARPIPFVPYKGQTLFFAVKGFALS